MVASFASSLAPSLASPTMHVMDLRAVVGEHGGAVFLLDGVLAHPPEDDRDTTLASVEVRGKGVYPMLPVDVHVPAEEEEHAIGLREVHAHVRVLGVQEGQLPLCPEGHAHGAVLVLGPLVIEGRAVVMEGLPVRGIAVPVEAGACGGSYKVTVDGGWHTLVSLCEYMCACVCVCVCVCRKGDRGSENERERGRKRGGEREGGRKSTSGGSFQSEVVSHLILDHLEGLGALWILGDEVSALVPADPITALGLLRLQLPHFFHKGVVDGPAAQSPSKQAGRQAGRQVERK